MKFSNGVFNRTKALFSLLSFIFVLSACATNKISDLYEFYEIPSQSESKLFEYRFVVDPNQRRAETSKRITSDRFAVSFRDMRDELEKYMDAFPYCSEGYFVYDENFDGQKYALLGECQESR